MCMSLGNVGMHLDIFMSELGCSTPKLGVQLGTMVAMVHACLRKLMREHVVVAPTVAGGAFILRLLMLRLGGALGRKA